MNNFIQRVLTAIVLIPLILLAVFNLENSYFSIVVLIIASIGLFEFATINKISTIQKIIVIGVPIVFTTLLIPNQTIDLFYFFIAMSIWWVFNTFIVITYPFNNLFINNKYFKTINGILLFLPFIFVLTLLQETPYILLLLFLIVITTDSFAYFSGKLFGKHKLAPNLSGGKTIEGVIGGVFFALVFASLYIYFILQERVINWILVIVFTSIISVIGDLYQSAYKRVAGVKDSGKILPGHGGIWDRIDGFLAAAPVFFATSVFFVI